MTLLDAFVAWTASATVVIVLAVLEGYLQGRGRRTTSHQGGERRGDRAPP